MNIELHEIPIRDIVEGYQDNREEGVVGYGGYLDIRPKYQREFVYNEKERNAVMDTIVKGFPLNIMYWAKTGDKTFEILDGQQRTVSFCQYVNGDFSINNRAFHNLTGPEKEKILNYKVMVYFCDGNEDEKLSWFKTVNIAGKELTAQELRNAVYTGTWLTDAKSRFSKTNCPAQQIAKDYLVGSAIQQEYLETALRWKSKGKIESYMSKHQHDPDANELWVYFRNVIDWVKLTFVNYRKEMKGVNWGALYDEYKENAFDIEHLEEEIKNLMMDDDIKNKKGIYMYVLTHNEKYLNIRTFSESQKRVAFEKQKGICKKCGKHFEIEEMHADHITPWSKGGKTIPENCQLLCAECNRRKSDI